MLLCTHRWLTAGVGWTILNTAHPWEKWGGSILFWQPILCCVTSAPAEGPSPPGSRPALGGSSPAPLGPFQSTSHDLPRAGRDIVLQGTQSRKGSALIPVLSFSS